MRRMPWATYLWPGLPQLWIHGSWSALGVAVGAAIWLNLALLGSFGWSELIGPELRTALWGVLGVVWAAAAVGSSVWSRRLGPREQTDPAADPFSEALEHYLQGNWFQAERTLGGLLRKNVRDLDARLMLATLLRHTGRFDEAGRQLDFLMRFEGIEKWELEVRRERELLAEARKRNEARAGEAANPKTTDPPAEMMHAA
jgi:hypothetical protein